MKRSLVLAVVALAAGAGIVETVSAKDYYERHEERRQAVVAGAVSHGVASARAEDRYRECMRGSGYDDNCARQRYRDEQDARRKGRRAAVAVAIVN
jgi:hypothetical protein